MKKNKPYGFLKWLIHHCHHIHISSVDFGAIFFVFNASAINKSSFQSFSIKIFLVQTRIQIEIVAEQMNLLYFFFFQF